MSVPGVEVQTTQTETKEPIRTKRVVFTSSLDLDYPQVTQSVIDDKFNVMEIHQLLVFIDEPFLY